jgi:type IV pilus assembly protein PilA
MQVICERRSRTAKVVTVKSFGGFTLVELLVSIVIVGALTTIALPSYLNQAAKARSSEAKAGLGSVNRSQQAYRWEHGTFADDITKLDLKVDGKFYMYSIVAGDATDSTARTISQQDGLRVASAAITLDSGVFKHIICESQNTQILNTSAVLPTGGAGVSLDCPIGYNNIN